MSRESKKEEFPTTETMGILVRMGGGGGGGGWVGVYGMVWKDGWKLHR